MKKRIISLLLCLVLIVSLMPAAAAASTSDSKTVTVRYASGRLHVPAGSRGDVAGPRLRGIFQQGFRI